MAMKARSKDPKKRLFQRSSSVAQFAQAFTEEQVAVMRELFDLCDQDGDGQVTPSELRSVMSELNVGTSEEETDNLFKSLDTNNDGLLSFGDFLSGFRWMQKSQRLQAAANIAALEGSASSPSSTSPTSSPSAPKLNKSKSVIDFIRDCSLNETELAKMEKLFQECDEDNNGGVSKQELWKFLHRQGVRCSKEEFISFFNELDEDKSGSLSFSEFAKGMRGLQAGFNMSIGAKGGKKMAARLKNIGGSNNKTSKEETSSPASSSPREDRSVQSKLKELEQKNAILFNYLKEFVSKGLDLAEREHAAKHYNAAAALLQLIDYPLVQNMAVFVGDDLTSTETDDLYNKLQKSLKSLNKK
ncbi:EF hand domain containing protein [Balamuthia mandrillaris]